MLAPRREFLKSALLAAAASQLRLSANVAKPGLPGPYPGRVIAVQSPASIVAGQYQPAVIDQMMNRGMLELTGAPGWPDAWRALFEPGDVVGIKVSPVGGPKLCSDVSVLRRIVDGLEQAGVKRTDIIVYSRYRQEILETNIDKWLPDGVRWAGASEQYNDVQLDMDGYDRDHYMEMALIKPGDDPNDSHFRRSYVAKVIAQQVNKFINLPVLKHHQSAGVTICLKNMSHGMVNNVNRSHLTPTLNACGIFIPSVVNLPVIRQKAVLQICDGVKASFHGGPGYKPQYVWEHKTMYFATDPVALDKTGLRAIDEQRARVGMASVALSKPDQFSTFLNCQVEHIEIAGMLGLGVFEDKKIDVRRITV
jgi:uncharacterized protein (DUF362 family)